LKIGKGLIDANWGVSTDVVYQFCRQSPYTNLLNPSHGRYVGAAGYSFSEYRRQPGDRVGQNWRIPALNPNRRVRHAVYDTNYRMSFVHGRLAVPAGEKSCLTLFGEKPDTHRAFAEHLTAEYRVKTEGRGRTVVEWRVKPGGGDNHWFDGVVGCAVAGSMLGAALAEHDRTPVPDPDRNRSSGPPHITPQARPINRDMVPPGRSISQWSERGY
jgi:hypothetical protein